MIGRPIEFNPDTALESAMQLFWTEGYEISSLQRLLGTMGISKSSFYQTFESKRSLFQQCLLRYRRVLAETLSERQEREGEGRQFITTLFLDLAADTSSVDSKRGCFLMNTASEFGQSDAEISELVRGSLDDLAGIFERAIIQAQKDGDVCKEKDAKYLALYLISSISGIKNMLKAGADQKSVEQIVTTSLSALG